MTCFVVVPAATPFLKDRHAPLVASAQLVGAMSWLTISRRLVVSWLLFFYARGNFSGILRVSLVTTAVVVDSLLHAVISAEFCVFLWLLQQ